VHPTANASFEIDPKEVNEDYPLVSFTNKSTGSNTYRLHTGDGSIYDVFPAQHLFDVSDDDLIKIMLIANNSFNCPDTAYQQLKILPATGLYIPNAFTPNGDQKNDIFLPVIAGEVSSYQLLIFNRWGEMIFQSNDQNTGWDGYYKNDKVQDDVYVYRLVYKLTGSEIKLIKIGRVTVLR
jgi:gliding motility-associated-like protein